MKPFKMSQKCSKSAYETLNFNTLFWRFFQTINMNKCAFFKDGQKSKMVIKSEFTPLSLSRLQNCPFKRVLKSINERTAKTRI